MSKQSMIDWGKWSFIAAAVVLLPLVTGYARKGFAIADTPEREMVLEQRVGSIETNCSANFSAINDSLSEIKRELKTKH